MIAKESCPSASSPPPRGIPHAPAEGFGVRAWGFGVLSLSLSLSLTHTLSLALSLSLSRTRTHSLSLSLSLSLSIYIDLSLSHTHAHSLSRSLSLPSVQFRPSCRLLTRYFNNHTFILTYQYLILNAQENFLEKTPQPFFKAFFEMSSRPPLFREGS